ncbi:MAG TPA: serine hydrolase domain-containing protein [Thermoanaerobaculia bacterium]|jgi:N-acyl-D-amino-acid deacylase
MTRRWLVSLALLAAVTASAETPSTGTVIPGMVSYDQLASTLLTKYQIAGGAIAVARNGKLVFARGYGYANKATGDLVQPDSRFRLASLSKPITSAAILLLVQQGKLSLDQRVFDLLSYEPLPGQSVDPRLATITIRNLLEHSGGWNRDTTFDPMFMPVAIAAATGTAAPATTDSIIRFMMGKPLQFNPGSDFNYSNFGYLLLGRVVETITGQPYEKFVREQVLAPSGAACMQIGRSLQTQSLPGEVKYYDFPGAPLVPSIYGTGTKVPRPDGGFYLEAMDAHGGWVASTIDYLRFVLSVDAINDPPDILSEATTKLMIARPTIPYWSTTPYWYAKGWQVRPSLGNANWWHSGGLPGTATIVVRNYGGLAWAAFFNSQPANADAFLEELDAGMWNALGGVTSWPSYDQFQSFAPCPAGPRRRAVRH